MIDLPTLLGNSLRVAAVATALVAVIAIPLAFAMARWRVPGRSVVEALLTLPLVLPPTVVGYFILIAAGRQSALGQWMLAHFDYSIIFNWHGAVVASAAVALPMLYMPAKAAFAGVDHELEDASRLLGANLLQQFWHVSLPLARRGIMSGLLLAFARAGRVRRDGHGARRSGEVSDAAHLDLHRLGRRRPQSRHGCGAGAHRSLRHRYLAVQQVAPRKPRLKSARMGSASSV
jgi:ABC-type nitrate/sulfonate/bicarbonate transport system permease component